MHAATAGITPKIKLGADTLAATADIDKFKVRLADLSRKVYEAGVGVKGGTVTELQLARIALSLSKLDKTVSKPSVTVEGLAAAEVHVLGLSLAMDKLGKSGGAGWWKKLTGALGGVGPAVGGPAGLAAVGGILVVVSQLASVVPALVAAGTGLASFGALALPTISAITTAYGGVTTATTAYQAASANLDTAIHKSPADMKAYQATIHGLEPDLQNAARLLTNQNVQWQNLSPSMQRSVIALSNNKTALKGLLPDQQKALTALLGQKKAWDGLNPAQARAVGLLGKLSGAFQSMAAKLAPDVMKIFNQGLGIASRLMPVLLGFARPAAAAIGGLLTSLSGFLKLSDTHTRSQGNKVVTWTTPTGFGTFVAQMQKLSGPAITVIGRGIGQIAIALGKLLQSLISPDSLATMRVIFGIVAVSIDVITKGMQIGQAEQRFLARAFLDTWHAAVAAWHGISHAWDNVMHAFDNVRHAIADAATGIADAFLNMIIRVLRGLGDLTGALGHLPGPLGAPFRDATKIIDTMIGRVQVMKKTIDGLTGKHIAISVSGTGHWNVLPGGTPQGPSGQPTPRHAAAGMYVAMGRPGVDDQLIRAMRGELVVPSKYVAAGAVDHLRGKIPGFGAGGIVGSYAGSPQGAGRWLAGDVAATTLQLENAVARGVLKALAAHAASGGGGGYGGPGGGSASANAALARHLFPAYASGPVWDAWNYVAMRESGWSNIAQNPSSGAYGIAQALPYTKYPRAGWPPSAGGSANPTAQITWMWDYMAQRYGGPIGAAQHEQAYSWYGRGGVIREPVLGVGRSGTMYGFGERGPETVTPGTGGGASGAEIAGLLADIRGLLDSACSLLDAAPGRTAGGVAQALGGAASHAAHLGMYSPR